MRDEPHTAICGDRRYCPTVIGMMRRAALLLVLLAMCAAAPPTSATGTLGSMGSFMCDGPFCTFAEPGQLGLRTPESRRRNTDKADAAATACRRSVAFVSTRDNMSGPEMRPREAAFVESSISKPLAEKVFDGVSVVGGVFVMGMSMMLP